MSPTTSTKPRALLLSSLRHSKHLKNSSSSGHKSSGNSMALLPSVVGLNRAREWLKADHGASTGSSNPDVLTLLALLYRGTLAEVSANLNRAKKFVPIRTGPKYERGSSKIRKTGGGRLSPNKVGPVPGGFRLTKTWRSRKSALCRKAPPLQMTPAQPGNTPYANRQPHKMIKTDPEPLDLVRAFEAPRMAQKLPTRSLSTDITFLPRATNINFCTATERDGDKDLPSTETNQLLPTSREPPDPPLERAKKDKGRRRPKSRAKALLTRILACFDLSRLYGPAKAGAAAERRDKSKCLLVFTAVCIIVQLPVFAYKLHSHFHHLRDLDRLKSHSHKKIGGTSPPTFIKQPPYELIYDRRILVTLECVADGEPEPTYHWERNSLRYDPSANNGRVIMVPGKGTLTITSPDIDDEGLYQCFATNQFGVAVSNAVRLLKARLEFFPATPQTNVVPVSNGDPLTLSCLPPKGIPPPHVFWLIADDIKEVKCSPRVMLDMDGNLNFAYVNASEDLQEGNPYTCVANNQALNVLHQGEFQVIKVVNPDDPIPKRAPEMMWTSSVNTLVLRTHKLILRCIYSGSPAPKITWRKLDGPLPEGRHTFDCFSHDLIIEDIRYQDAGDYECRAANGVGEDQKRVMRVQVQSAPYWEIRPEDAKKAEDETHVIKCVAKGVPSPQIQWYFNGKPIADAPYNERRKVEFDTISIVDLKKDVDIGVYQCNASNTHGYIFANAYLNIQAEPPAIVNRSALLQVVDNDSANMTCVTTGSPTPRIVWVKDGVEVTGGRYQTLPQGNLYIEKVIHSDAGNYTCVAKNKFGEESASGKLVVKSHTVIQTKPQSGEVRIGEPVVFRCSAVSDPSLNLSIEWEKNSEPIDYLTSQRVFKNPQDNSLTITNTQESDTASYVCVARTALDNARAAANLTVQDVPNPPDDVTLVTCLQDSAIISWRPTGDNSAPVSHFIIQYNTSYEPEEWVIYPKDVPASERQYRVDLYPHANYSFRVLAENRIGRSPASPSSTQACSTPPDRPARNPTDVVGAGDKPDELKISWTPMPLLERAGPGFHYLVEYRPADGQPGRAFTSIPVDGDNKSVVISNQPTYQPYEIQVTAVNDIGQAEVPPVPIIGFSGEDVPLAPVPDFRLIDLNGPNSARFAWGKVDQKSLRGQFKGYKILTWTPDEGFDKAKATIVEPSDETALVKTLKPYATNIAVIRPINNYYEGPLTPEIRLQTPEGTPEMVENFRSYPLGSNALQLFWRPPSEPNGVLKGYRIFYSKVEGTDIYPEQELFPVITDPSVTETKLPGLESDTKYRVMIAATTATGIGQYDWREVKTAAAGPPEIPQFAVTRTEPKKVNLTWLPSESGNPGSLFYTQYRIKGDDFWQRTDDEFVDSWQVVENLEPGLVYQFRVVAQNDKYITPSEIQDIKTSGIRDDSIATAGWFVGLMCALAILLLIMIIVCLIRRNRGGKYPVHEKERQKGLDPDSPDEGAFNEYTKPDESAPFRKSESKRSLTTNGVPFHGGSETDSMAEYGELETGKFDEDGSFIGQYGRRQSGHNGTRPSRGSTSSAAQAPRSAAGHKNGLSSPSALATFV